MAYGKYRIGCLSLAELINGQPDSSVMADFPMISAPSTPYGQALGEIQAEPWWKGSKPQRTVGRVLDEADPHYGEVLWVDAAANPLLVDAITQHGVNSKGIYAMPQEGASPDVGIVTCQVTDADTIIAIENHAKHFVLGIDNVDLQDPEADLPGWMDPYLFDEPFPASRWTALYNILDSRGMDMGVVDTWRAANPDATPRQFAAAYKNYLKGQGLLEDQ